MHRKSYIEEIHSDTGSTIFWRA